MGSSSRHGRHPVWTQDGLSRLYSCKDCPQALPFLWPYGRVWTATNFELLLYFNVCFRLIPRPFFNPPCAGCGTVLCQREHARAATQTLLTMGSKELDLDLSQEMMRAAASDNVPAVTRCLAEGASPNAVNPIGQTALHIAAIWNHVKVAKVLIDVGASLSPPNQYGATPLHFAAQKGNVEFCQLLLAYGVDLTVKNLNGVMPWETASGELRPLLGGPPNDMHVAVQNLDLTKLAMLVEPAWSNSP